MENIKQRIERLRELINYHNEKYFIEDNPEISDETYDQLLVELKQLEDTYPQYQTFKSPTQTVGAYAQNTFNPVQHKIPMLSLGKVHNLGEFDDWMDKKIEEMINEYFAELKMDGLAIDLEYEDSDLIVGATRGNGRVGDDVTATVNAIKDIPKRIEGFTGHVRGEIYLKKSMLESINTARVLEGKNKFANVRNAAAGLLRRKEVTEENASLSFAAYGLVIEGEELKSYSDTTLKLEEMGIPTVASLASTYINVNNNTETTKMAFSEFFKYVESIRDKLDYEIDGIVIKANKIEDQKRLGSKSNAPEWAVAYKFPAQSKTTKLLDVEWTMGNKGNITPNARIEPVEIGGTTVRNVTLHNLEELKRLELMIGDTIIVSRRGDVIPKVEGIVKDLRTGEEEQIVPPHECPSCSSPTLEKGAYLRCSAGTSCEYMTFARIQNFVQALEIDGFGPKVIEKILEHGFAKELVDIFDLTVEQLSEIERMGKRSATKLINNIQAAKEVPYERILMGMTIPGVGSSTSEDLVAKYGEPVNLLNLLLMEYHIAVSELSSIEGIAEKSADKILTWLRENQDTLVKLSEKGIGKMEEIVTSSNKLEGMVFATSGKVSTPRKQLEAMIVDNGGQFTSIKKGITHFIAGDGAKEAKITKAESLGAKVIDEATFIEMVGE